MIITCQNCQTHYSVDSRAIGVGKTVRCGNCGNSWHQNPVRASARRMAPQPMPQYAQPMPYPYPPPHAQPTVDPRMAYAQAGYPAAAPPPPPMLEPPPMPEPEPMPEPPAIQEPEPIAEEIPEPAPEPAAEPAAAPPEAGELSPAQLDEMFGDEPEPEAIQPLQESGAAENVDDLSQLEQLPEPEPIPQVFQPDADDEAGAAEAGKGGKGKIIGIAAAVLVLAVVAGLFFGRGFITGMWPGAAGIYAMVGFGGEELGAGLEIRDVASARTVEGGVDALVVSGVVTNVSKDDRQVPMLRVALLDGNGVEVQHVVAAPLKNRLPAGQNIAFKAHLPEPSALARRLEVTFTKDDKAAAKKK